MFRDAHDEKCGRHGERLQQIRHARNHVARRVGFHKKIARQRVLPRLYHRQCSQRSGSDLRVTRRQVASILGTASMPLASGCTSILGPSAEDRLLQTYQEGFSSYKSGTELHNEAVIAYRSDAYTEVQNSIQEALDPLASARESFRTTRDIASENGMAEARQIAESAVKKTQLLIEASGLLSDTATRFHNDNPEQAQESYDAYRDRMTEFDRVQIYPPRVLEERLDSGIFDL